MYVLTLVTKPHTTVLTPPLLDALITLCGGELVWLQEGYACDIRAIGDISGLREQVAAHLHDASIDWCLQPEEKRRRALLICDMDSTMIAQECIDEIADMHGIGAHVAEITERAMQGELDFSASLHARVALLKGLDERALEDVWEQRIRLTPGAKTLVSTMAHHGAHTMLVSGGFTFFTHKVAQAVGFHEHHANKLVIEDGVLCGDVIAPVLDKDAKKRLLLERCTALGIAPEQALAVGDGANDADMIVAAGLGVAYYAKPFLQSQADAAIAHTDLTTLLYFQGLTPSPT